MAESIFPDIQLPDDLNNDASSETVSYGKELAFDFKTGEFVMVNGNPKLYEGVEALKVWIEKTIRTARYRFPIYSFEYGSELEDIIGYDIPRPVLESEVKRVITEALTYDDRIEAVQDFVIERGGDSLTITFRVIHIFGEPFKQEVSVSV